MKPIAIYDGNSRKRLCYLQNAYDISYTKQNSSLWNASFKLPYNDSKKKYCDSMNYVELWDKDSANNDKYVGLFRIMPQSSEMSMSENSIVYSLEHVLATLIDDVMLGWTEIGNLGVYTKQVINHVLSKQKTKRWVLGECDYTHQYLYGWQDENLLSALFSITNSFVEDNYRWVFDTTSYPWTISLKKTSDKAVTDIRYKKNINSIKKTVDPTNLTTRLYCYGYGDGDNRLNIKSVNNNLDYIDSGNISKYGLITKVWTDERYTNETSLMQAGKAMIKSLEEPIISYDVNIAMVRAVSDLEAGDTVRVVDDGIDIYTKVVSISKDDVSGQPYVGSVVLANKNTDIAQSVADMADRQRIATTYSQGAESLYSDSIYDNADSSNPAELSFNVPDNAVHINEILFTARLTNFRAYSKAIEGGGATSTSTNSGGSSQNTSGSNATKEISSANGGNTSMTSGNGGSINTTSESFVMGLSNLSNTTTNDDNGYNHNHGLSRGTRIVTSITPIKSSDGKVTDIDYTSSGWTPSGAHSHGSHNHSISIPSHAHLIQLPNHTHRVEIPSHDHSISIPSHQHSFSIPNHSHGIEYGIYKGATARTMTVYIDNMLIGTFSSYVNGINLITYMSKNSSGEITRGRHTIKIVPDGITRVECGIQVRLFTNSHGSGQY